MGTRRLIYLRASLRPQIVVPWDLERRHIRRGQRTPGIVSVEGVELRVLSSPASKYNGKYIGVVVLDVEGIYSLGVFEWHVLGSELIFMMPLTEFSGQKKLLGRWGQPQSNPWKTTSRSEG